MNAVKPNSKKGNYFLFYGRLSEEKGITTLLKAFSLSGVKQKLKIAGNGPLKDEILEFVQEKKLSNIEYLGFKQKNELLDLISNASFVVVPSEWYENNPLTIVESYAYGKPVIGSNVGGIPEIIKDGNTGHLFKMRDVDALAEAINKASLLSEQDYINYSKNARTFAEQYFSPEKHYQKLLEIYLNVMNKL